MRFGYKHYQVILAGYKYNMMDIQASMGIHQLKRIDKYWERRKKVWEIYNEAFIDLPCLTPEKPQPHTKHAYHLYTVLINTQKTGRSRDWVLNALTCENIGVGVHYVPLHLHPFYRKTYGWKEGDFPNAEWIGDRTISIPLSAALTDKDVSEVLVAMHKVLR